MNRQVIPMTTSSQNRRRIQVGAVNYLNSKPLIERLLDFAPDIDLHLDFPSRLADGLHNGQYDVALIPSIEVVQEPGFEIVSDACVATRGEVYSVKLFSRVPVTQIQKLALDEGSRTSAVLVQILLSKICGITPELESLSLGSSIEDSTADAILMIGDRAMHSQSELFEEIWDLGAKWKELTKLPFVFAVWAARRERPLANLDSAFSMSRDAGLTNLSAIAEQEAVKLGIPMEMASEYLHENLHFQLGAEERRGFELFVKYAQEQHLIPKGKNIVFRDCTHS